MAEHEIDEDFLLASIGDKKEGKKSPKKEETIEVGRSEPAKPKEVPSNKRKRSNTGTGDYENDFLCRNEISDRKSVYVSDYVHEKIKQIVKQIGGLSDISVGGYIDNVMKHHLEKYKDEINTLYKKTRTDLLE